MIVTATMIRGRESAVHESPPRWPATSPPSRRDASEQDRLRTARAQPDAGGGLVPVLRSEPMRDSASNQNGAPNETANPVSRRPRAFSAQPPVVAGLVAVDHHSGSPPASSEATSSFAHLVRSAGSVFPWHRVPALTWLSTAARTGSFT